jgi:predicted dehydrogenase
VKGTGVLTYTSTGQTSRHIHGTADIDGSPGSYDVDVADNGEPGRDDTFALVLSTGYTSGGKLQGGNIQLHCK